VGKPGRRAVGTGLALLDDRGVTARTRCSVVAKMPDPMIATPTDMATMCMSHENGTKGWNSRWKLAGVSGVVWRTTQEHIYAL
jgi:hypothetical protein